LTACVGILQGKVVFGSGKMKVAGCLVDEGKLRRDQTDLNPGMLLFVVIPQVKAVFGSGKKMVAGCSGYFTNRVCGFCLCLCAVLLQVKAVFGSGKKVAGCLVDEGKLRHNQTESVLLLFLLVLQIVGGA
jgi:hypothetical protein